MEANIRDTQNAQIVDIAVGDTTESIKAKLPEGAVLKAITIGVDTAFDGTATLSIGTSTNKTKFINAQSLTATGATLKTQLYISPKNGEPIYFKVGGTPTVGAAKALIEYYTKNEYVGNY